MPVAGEALLCALGDHADLAPVDGLAVGLRFLDDAQDLAHHDRGPGGESVGRWTCLFFEADLDEVGHDVFGRCSGRYLREFTQPGKWDTHCLDLHPEVLAETYVAFDHVAHVADVVAEHQGTLDAHAEGKT